MTSYIKRIITVLFAMLIIGIGAFAMVSAQPVYAADDDLDSGTYDGVPWRITSDYELIIGETGKTYTYTYKESRTETDYPWDSYRSQLQSISIAGQVNGNGSLAYMFFECRNATSVIVTGLNTSNVTNMRCMFCGLRVVTTLNLSGFNTSNCTDISNMFGGCFQLTGLDLSNFDTSKVTDMGGMFPNCRALTYLKLTNFNTSNVTNMAAMFQACSSLTEIDLSMFDASKATEMQSMFYNNTSLTTLKIGKNFNTAIPDDGIPVTFPKTMYDSQTGTMYEEGSDIPSTNYRTYVTDPGVVGPWVDEHPEGNVDFSYDKSYTKASYGQASVYYDNDFFATSNKVYNHDLATASLGLAMAGMRKGNVEDFLKQCSFNYYDMEQERYDTTLANDEDKVAYTFAVKQIDGQDVVAIVLRGGNYGNEWGSNGRVGHLGKAYGYHYGFNTAAGDVIDHLEAFCENRIDLQNAKIWLTGYSRSAAVANCVGTQLEGRGLIDKNNLYCYTFATPRTVAKRNVYAATQGIYNIVNPVDIVTCVPLNASTFMSVKKFVNPISGWTHFSDWSYTRHGTTLELPSRFGTKKYDNKLATMQTKFYEITNYERDYVKFDGLVLQSLLDILVEVSGDEDHYVTYLQDLFIVPALEKHMDPEYVTTDTTVFQIISVIPGARELLRAAGFTNLQDQSKLPELNESSEASDLADLIMMEQHWPETYLAWMKTGIKPKKATLAKSLIVQCPVDVKVYDSDNNLVAKITNDVVDKSINDRLEAYVDASGTKAIAMPADGNYRVELTATDDGIMTYSIKETDEDRELQRKVTYENIEIEKNQVFTGEVNDELNTETENYNLQTGEETIEATHDYTGDDLNNIEITADVSGPGIVLGDGLYTAGDSVVLQAYEEDNSTFDGWYEGETLVSTESALTFKADTSKSYTAKFTANPSAPSDPCASGHTWQHITNPAGLLKNGNEYDQCTVCGIQQNMTALPGYANYYVKGMKVAKGKKSFTVKWKKQSKKNLKKFNGYQIRYSTKSDMSGAKYKTAGKKATSKAIKKLKAKTKYYVQVRTYTKSGGVTYYSKWSAKKSVKTK